MTPLQFPGRRLDDDDIWQVVDRASRSLHVDGLFTSLSRRSTLSWVLEVEWPCNERHSTRCAIRHSSASCYQRLYRSIYRVLNLSFFHFLSLSIFLRSYNKRPQNSHANSRSSYSYPFVTAPFTGSDASCCNTTSCTSCCIRCSCYSVQLSMGSRNSSVCIFLVHSSELFPIQLLQYAVSM